MVTDQMIKESELCPFNMVKYIDVVTVYLLSRENKIQTGPLSSSRVTTCNVPFLN